MDSAEAKRLRYFMEKEKLTQADVAELFGKDQSRVSKYISGSLKIPLDLVKVLHSKCNLNYSWFFHGTGSIKIKEKEKPSLVTDIIELNAKYAALQHQVDGMRDTINFLLKNK